MWLYKLLEIGRVDLTRMEARAYDIYDQVSAVMENTGASLGVDSSSVRESKLQAAQSELTAAESRVQTMSASVASLAQRASAIEANISRTVASRGAAANSAVASGPAATAGLDLELEDPLERKFRDLEGK